MHLNQTEHAFGLNRACIRIKLHMDSDPTERRLRYNCACIALKRQIDIKNTNRERIKQHFDSPNCYLLSFIKRERQYKLPNRIKITLKQKSGKPNDIGSKTLSIRISTYELKAKKAVALRATAFISIEIKKFLITEPTCYLNQVH